ncbi:MAG: malonate--CoA ligase [Paracoccaceae bacterium]
MANLLYDALFGRHAGNADPFLCLKNGEVIAYDDFLRLSGRLANAILQLGLDPDARVAVQVEKSPQALAIYAACVQAGLIILPLNPAYTADEITYFLNDSGAELLVCSTVNRAKLTKKLPVGRLIIETLESDGTGSLMTLADQMPDNFRTAARQGDDLAALLYTSGTTGRAKGAMLTHENLLSNARALAGLWRFDADDVLLHVLPIFHTHGLFVATNVTLLAGGSMIYLPNFDQKFVIQNMHRATTMMGVPTHYTRLLDDPGFDENCTKNMRLFISGSAPLLAETHARFEAVCGHRILERYGMTETNMNTSNPYKGERRPGTVGLPLENVELKITDPVTGKTLPAGEIGQIEVRGPNVFKGYWNMPEKTQKDLRTDGYFITGDLGLIDADGYLQIIGRNIDLIISGGFNIYPKEIELLLDQQPGVLESAVIGAPHPDIGEMVIGVVVAQPGHQIDISLIREEIAKSLARYKQPRELFMLPALPRNAMGKVQKNILRDMYRNGQIPG